MLSSRSRTSPPPVLLLGAEALMWGAGDGTTPGGAKVTLVCDTCTSVIQVGACEVRLDVWWGAWRR